MSSKEKHKKRSQRSSHEQKPFDMFARNARLAAYKKNLIKEKGASS